MTFLRDANAVRTRLPYAYWLFYDGILLPFLVWGFVSLSHTFAVPIAFLGISLFFDIIESIIKWKERDNGRRTRSKQGA